MIIHPHIGNDKRQAVMDWCEKKFGPYNEEDSVWCATSNYDRSKDGTFDVHFEDMYEALWFLSKWGGEVVDLVQTA
jgi:hypothetical protein